MNTPIPDRLKRFPLWRGRFPIHYTVWVGPDGEPDFKVMHERRREECFNKNLCHLCGQRMSAPYALIGGPLCVDGMAFVDGPMHPECATYAALVCPFLSSPQGKYRAEIPTFDEQADGSYIKVYDNVSNIRPAKMALCLVESYRVVRNPPTGHQSGGPHATNPTAPNQLTVRVTGYISVDWDLMPHSAGD